MLKVFTRVARLQQNYYYCTLISSSASSPSLYHSRAFSHSLLLVVRNSSLLLQPFATNKFQKSFIMSDSEDSFVDDSGSDFEEQQPKKKAAASTKSPKKAEPTKSKSAASSQKTTKAAVAPKKKAAGAEKSNGTSNNKSAENPMDVFQSLDNQKGKRMSIETMYQKKTQLEHILLRPDTYIGSVEFCDKAPMWVYDVEQDKMVNREISYVPGLYKIFDEILVNAADNKQRDKKMNLIKITIDKEKNEISVYNNGKGIPVVEHKTEKMYVPELIFGTLLTSSNYNDDERKVTGGRNGYGAKLCNIFSTKFVLETSSKEYKRSFKQTWVNNMNKNGEATIDAAKAEDFTKVTFRPDLKKFKMTELDDDIIALMSRRAYDIAGASKGVNVYLNGKKIPVSGFKQYVELYTKEYNDSNGEPYKVAHEVVNDRWEIAVTVSEKNFQQVSFVNSIATTKGGRHVDYITDQIVSNMMDSIKKKVGKGNIQVKPFQVKNHVWVFVNCLIENPSFDSQTKETLTTLAKSFGSTASVSEKFSTSALKCGIADAVLSWVRFKQQEQADKKCSAKKTSKIKGIPKLEDANDAGTKNSHLCTLILTEGDSAKTLAVAGLGVIGRDRYGVFPLRGKMLNVREGNHAQIMKNAEVTSLLKILGLQYKLKYNSEDEMKTLRYGKVMIMADQDMDGSHIKGLVINFIHYNWPNLIKKNYVEEFITPIIKATKGKEEISFFSIPEYMEWRQNTPNWKNYRVKYYKGLGTSTSKEAKEYFSDMLRHRIKFDYKGQPCDDAIDLAFSKKKIEERKDWLTRWMEVRKQIREENGTEDYLYCKDTRSVSYSDFINRELILFSNTDNERSIPSLVDGLKPGQRKVLFTCFKRADKKEVKVAQLAGAVGEMSAYHHGEASLMSTIVNLAQDFVGSNNINLLLPIGQFGTRLQGGKDSASPRYIFTQLSPVTKALFPSDDEYVLKFLYEENQRIEPEWYAPIIPVVLCNGAEGIGTAWSTKVPNYNPRDLVENIRRLIRGEPMKRLIPWYKHFKGTIVEIDSQHFCCNGEVSVLSDDALEITELPIKTWTQNYKESVLETMLENDTKSELQINDFKEYHTDVTVKFIVKLPADKLRKAEAQGLHKVMKLQTTVATTSMVLFDGAGCLRKFTCPEDICREFYEVRKKVYIDRKRYIEGMLQAQSDRLSHQARFIMLKIENKIFIENKKKSAIIEQLVKLNFPPDPVKKWKDAQKKKEIEAAGEVGNDEESGDEDAPDAKNEKRVQDYDYLVGMAMWKLSTEDKDKLLAESEAKKAELTVLNGKSWSDLWEEDLKNFLEALEKQERKEEGDIEEAIKIAAKKILKDKATGGRGKKAESLFAEIKPNPHAIRIEPTIAHMKEKYEAKPAKKAAVVKAEGGKPKSEGADMRQFLEVANDTQNSNEENEDKSNGIVVLDGSDIEMMEVVKPPPKKVATTNETTTTEDDKPKKVATKRTKDDTKTKPESKSKSEPKPKPKASKPEPKSKAPEKKKKIVSSDDEDDDDDDIEILSDDDDDEDDDSAPSTPIKRENAPRRAAAAAAVAAVKKYKIADSDDDDSDVKLDSEEDEAPKPKKAKARIQISDDEDDFFV